MTSILNLTEATTAASTDYFPVVVNGVTSRISLANLQKLVGGSGTSSSGTTGSTNLILTPTDLSGGANSKWVAYSASGGMNRAGGGRIVITSGTTTSNVIYQSFDPTATAIKAGSTFTLGAMVTRAAGTGSGSVRGNTYYEGSQVNTYSSVPTATDGVAFQVSITFTVQSGNGAIHIGFDFTPGGGDFTFTNVTMVAGSTYNPNAT